MVEAVLFDLDGTLLDTAPDLIASTHEALRKQGFEPELERSLRAYVSGGARGLVLGAKIPKLDEERAIADLLAHYRANISVLSTPFPGALELLDALEARGVPWGIVTNKSTELTHALRVHQPLLQRVKVLVCGDTLSVRKPDPKPLLLAAEQLGSNAQSTLYVGDDRRDMQAAKAAGMPGVIALWGYLGDDPDPLAWPHSRAIRSLSDFEQHFW